MQAIEIEGKTIDEAIEKACAELQAPREKLNIEIIAEGSTGFLGLGSKKARIRAALLSLTMSLDAASNPPLAAEQPHREVAVQVKEQREQPKMPVLPSTTEREKDAEKDGEGMAAQAAQRFLEGLLQRMSLECPVSVEETSEKIILNIHGDGGGLIIGKRGQNLDALQYMVNKAVNKTGGDRKMIIIDTEAYRKRREESLVSLAEKLGEKVKRTRKAVTVGHMHAHDRRIIHLALQDDDSLTTKSRGEGEYRKIIIMPAKKE
jgi:spoIIIJ-associated protein